MSPAFLIFFGLIAFLQFIQQFTAMAQASKANQKLLNALDTVDQHIKTTNSRSAALADVLLNIYAEIKDWRECGFEAQLIAPTKETGFIIEQHESDDELPEFDITELEDAVNEIESCMHTDWEDQRELQDAVKLAANVLRTVIDDNGYRLKNSF